MNSAETANHSSNVLQNLVYSKIYLKHLEFNCMFWHGLEIFLIWINIFYGIVMPELSVMLFLYGKTALVVVKTFRSSPPWSLLKPGPRSWTWTLKNLESERPGPRKTWTVKCRWNTAGCRKTIRRPNSIIPLSLEIC